MESTNNTEVYDLTLPRKASDELIWAQETERLERMNSGVDPLMMGKLFKCQTEMMHKNIPTTLLNDARSTTSSTMMDLSETATSMKSTAQDTASSLASSVQDTASVASEKLSAVRERASSITQSIIENVKETSQMVMEKIGEVAKDIDRAQEEFAVNTNNSFNKMVQSITSSTNQVVEKSSEFSVATNELVEDVTDKINGVDISSAAAEEKERLRRANEKIDPIVEGRKHRVEDELLHTVKSVN